MSKRPQPVQIIQNSRPTDSMLNVFSKEQFISSIKQLSQDDFDYFCKKILRLQEFYDWNCYVWATDKDELTYGKEEFFWQPGPIDFEAPINFRIKNKDDDLEDEGDEDDEDDDSKDDDDDL